MNRAVLAVAVAAVALMGASGGAATAQAAPAAHAAPALAGATTAQDPFNLCLNLAEGECIKSNGAGSQVTIETSDVADFHVVLTESGTNWEQLENAAGNCLREYADSTVGLAFGGCSSTNDAEWWFDSNPGHQCCPRTTLENLKYANNYLGTFGTGNDQGVYAEPQGPGFDAGWVESPS